jgi:hypothetical protein
MPKKLHHCPACDRAFESILDYPRIRVLSFKRLPIPEAVDYSSDAAASKSLARKRRDLLDPATWREEGINMTPQIEQACNTHRFRIT